MTGTGLPEGAWTPLHDVGRGFARTVYRCGFRVRVYGIQRVPRTGPVVVISNHSSLIEPQLIYGMLPRRAVFLVKDELDTGVLGWGLRRIGQIPVRRGGVNRTAMATAQRLLRSGGVVCVFPEGKRGGGDVTNAEGGAAWLVRASGAVVVPLATRGTLRPAGTGRRFRPEVDMLVGEPLAIDVGQGRRGLEEATERMRGALSGLVRELDQRRESVSHATNEARKDET